MCRRRRLGAFWFPEQVPVAGAGIGLGTLDVDDFQAWGEAFEHFIGEETQRPPGVSLSRLAVKRVEVVVAAGAEGCDY